MIALLPGSLLLMLFLLPVILLASCGRKGPPTLPVYEQPPAPSELTVVHREGEIVLEWDYPSRKRRMVKEFRIMRSGTSIAATRELSYVDSDIKTAREYSYKVLALSKEGVPGEGSREVKLKVLEVPSAPAGLEAEVVARGVRLRWSHLQEGVLFNVYRSAEKGLSPLRPANREPITSTEFIDNPYMAKPVFYTVRAFTGGLERHEGAKSGEVEIRPEDFVPSPPEGLKAVLTGGKVLLAWEESPEVWVRAYRVYRALGGEDFVLVGESRTPTFIDGEVLEGRVSYKVKALGPALEGPLSGAVSVRAE